MAAQWKIVVVMLPDNKLHFKNNIKAWLHQRGYLSQFLKASNFTLYRGSL